MSRAVLNEAVIGFNTRAINISDRLMGLISSDKVQPLSYMSISVNAATNEKYKFVNGAGDTRVPLYDKVLENVRKLCASVKRNKSHLDVSVSYLVNQFTSNEEDIEKFIVDFKSAEVDLIRFSCPQVPRGSELANNLFIPSLQEYQKYFEDIQAIVNKYKSDKTAILVLPHLAEYDVSRTMPCFARFIYPTVGYDGWLYHCSQSAGVNFRSQALGNLETNSFWECLYNYDATDLDEYFQSIQKKMCANNCRCDRKEHTVNAALRSNFF